MTIPIREADPSDNEVPPRLAAALDRARFRGRIHWLGDIAVAGVSPMVGIVGTREPSQQGLAVVAGLAGGLATAGATVVSGAARGVDMGAHGGALDAGGATVACVPGGLATLDVPVWRPRFAAALAGAPGRLALVSVFPVAQVVTTQTPAIRNRLIAALAEVLVVGEAAAQSGTHLCTRAALDLGVPIFFLVPANRADTEPTLARLHQRLEQRGGVPFTATEATRADFVEEVLAAGARYRAALAAAEAAQLKLF